jgi:hypothetical protein
MAMDKDEIRRTARSLVMAHRGNAAQRALAIAQNMRRQSDTCKALHWEAVAKAVDEIRVSVS